jgi:alpha-1,6-mannosyltransferase
VVFLGHVGSRTELAAVLAGADVALAPGPVETFGLAALEALACGTPVVASVRSALPALIGDAGACADTPAEYAAAVRRLLGTPEAERRTRARARAERYTWPAAVDAFLAAHGAAALPARTPS